MDLGFFNDNYNQIKDPVVLPEFAQIERSQLRNDILSTIAQEQEFAVLQMQIENLKKEVQETDNRISAIPALKAKLVDIFQLMVKKELGEINQSELQEHIQANTALEAEIKSLETESQKTQAKRQAIKVLEDKQKTFLESKHRDGVLSQCKQVQEIGESIRKKLNSLSDDLVDLISIHKTIAAEVPGAHKSFPLPVNTKEFYFPILWYLEAMERSAEQSPDVKNYISNN